MFCAGSGFGTGSPCSGDSGGGLVYSNPNNNDELELVGIVSWGIDCNKPLYAAVFTNVCDVKDWIEKRLQSFQINPFSTNYFYELMTDDIISF